MVWVWRYETKMMIRAPRGVRVMGCIGVRCVDVGGQGGSGSLRRTRFFLAGLRVGMTFFV